MHINFSSKNAQDIISNDTSTDFAELQGKFAAFRARINSGTTVGDAEFAGRKVSDLIQVNETVGKTGAYPCIVWNPAGKQRELSIWKEGGKETFLGGLHPWKFANALQDGFVLQVYDILKVDFHQSYFDTRMPEVRDILAVKSGGIWNQFSWKGNGFMNATSYLLGDHLTNFIGKHETINALLQALIADYPVRITFWDERPWNWLQEKYFNVTNMTLADYANLRSERIATAQANRDLDFAMSKEGLVKASMKVDRSAEVLIGGKNVRQLLRSEAICVVVDGVKLSLHSANQAGIDKIIQAQEAGRKVEVVSK